MSRLVHCLVICGVPMISEEIILERDRVECLVRNLADLLKVESHFQFKLRFTKLENGGQSLTIIPHAAPVEITLSK